MKLLFICAGYLPYTFSENLCNGKLVYALKKAGIQVDVISKEDNGPTYHKEWQEPWLFLKDNTYEISYPTGNKISRLIDVIVASIKFKTLPHTGIRWAERAFEKALELYKQSKYDAVLTRSPSDIPHIVGYQIHKITGIKWIANWNDPASTIWPEPYTHNFSFIKRISENRFSVKMLREADINTFPSKRLCEHFIRNYPFLQKKHNVVIPHIGLQHSLLPETDNRRNSSIMRMCHSGNLSKERNSELLFIAIKELSEQGYAIALDIMGFINEYTSKLIAKYSLEKQIKFIGNHTYTDALQIMSSYDVLVLIEAQMKEGIFFPSKITDYIQLGKPVLAVSPACGFANDIFHEFGGGIAVDNTNVDSIREGLKDLYHAWQEGCLQQNYTSTKLYEAISPDKIVDEYRSLIS